MNIINASKTLLALTFSAALIMVSACASEAPPTAPAPGAEGGTDWNSVGGGSPGALPCNEIDTPGLCAMQGQEDNPGGGLPGGGSEPGPGTNPGGGDPGTNPGGDPGNPGGGDPGDTACNTPIGRVAGRLCVPSANEWVSNADVLVEYIDCNGLSASASTTTDLDGNFVLGGIPAGDHTLFANKGPYSAEFDITINANQTTNIDPGEFCFDNNTINIAVVDGEYDSVETVLEHLGFEYRFYYQGSELLRDPNTMATFDAIFINCGSEAEYEMEFGGHDIANNLQSYVSTGGRLYASDWAWIFVDRAFPGKLNFHSAGWDSTPLVGPAGNLDAAVNDAGLQAHLGGQSNVTLDMEEGQWAVVDSASFDVDVLLTANVNLEFGGSINNAPILTRFGHGGGEVIFTSYHLEHNQGVNGVLSYMVLSFQ